jgi:hypothetical protein
MTPRTSCLDAVGEFRVVAEHIGTRDLVQEYLANRIFPTLKEWGMPKLKGEKKKNELVRLPYHFKFKNTSKNPAKNGWIQLKSCAMRSWAIIRKRRSIDDNSLWHPAETKVKPSNGRFEI